MRITIAGTPGSGKSMAARAVAEQLGLRHYSMGDMQREYANALGVSIGELMQRAEQDPRIDQEIDERQRILGEREEGFVIDSRLGAKFIPHAHLKVFLDASPKIRAQRVWAARRSEERGSTAQDLLGAMDARDASDDKRYGALYGISYHDPKLYDHVLDTSAMTKEEVVTQIVNWVRARQ